MFRREMQALGIPDLMEPAEQQVAASFNDFFAWEASSSSNVGGTAGQASG
jgi:hypothetical protein